MGATRSRKPSIKAAHKGHCQICGACQKLPGGVLAKHGYTTKWGFFSGVCSGSGHLPFEQDKSLIEGAITRAKDDEKATRDQAAAVRLEENPEDCWFNAYLNFGYSRAGTSGYQWIRTRLATPAELKFPRLSYWHPGDGKPARWEQAGYYGKGGEVGAARYFNGQYAARYLEPRADSLRDYVRWQEGRIANWTPQPLTPID